MAARGMGNRDRPPRFIEGLGYESSTLGPAKAPNRTDHRHLQRHSRLITLLRGMDNLYLRRNSREKGNIN